MGADSNLSGETVLPEDVGDDDDVEAVDVCSYCFENVHMSMFGIVDEFCSGKCADAWQTWWQGAKSVQA